MRLSIGPASATDQQELVNSHFMQHATEWGDIYNRAGVSEITYQERLQAVLGLVDRIGLPTESRVLEIGCGAGYAAVALAERGYQVEAIDAVQKMVESTRDLAATAGLEQRVRSSLGDVNCLSFPDGAFALVVAIGLLPWQPSLPRPLREMTRVLRRGGYLIITTYNHWSFCRLVDPLTSPLAALPKRLIKNIVRRYRPGPQTQARIYATSIRQCDSAVKAAGLEKLDGITLGFGPFALFGRELFSRRMGLAVHHAMQGLADRGVPLLRSGGTHYIVLASKPAASSTLRATA